MRTDLHSLSDVRLRALWPPAAVELRGFARHLQQTQATITAAQIRLAVQMAEEYFRTRCGPEGDHAQPRDGRERG